MTTPYLNKLWEHNLRCILSRFHLSVTYITVTSVWVNEVDHIQVCVFSKIFFCTTFKYLQIFIFIFKNSKFLFLLYRKVSSLTILYFSPIIFKYLMSWQYRNFIFWKTPFKVSVVILERIIYRKTFVSDNCSRYILYSLFIINTMVWNSCNDSNKGLVYYTKQKS